MYESACTSCMILAQHEHIMMEASPQEHNDEMWHKWERQIRKPIIDLSRFLFLDGAGRRSSDKEFNGRLNI